MKVVTDPGLGECGFAVNPHLGTHTADRRQPIANADPAKRPSANEQHSPLLEGRADISDASHIDGGDDPTS